MWVRPPPRARCSVRLNTTVLPKFICPILLAFIGCILDCRSAEVFIRVNQLGYNPADPKFAIAFSKENLPDSFSIVSLVTQQPVYQGKAVTSLGLKWGQFENHVELDFSNFRIPGHYQLLVGRVRSLPFVISPTVYTELPDQLLEFMRQQRCGYNPWLDAICHPFDGRTAFGPMANGTYLDVRGGYPDPAAVIESDDRKM